MDANGVFDRCYDKTTSQVTVTVVNATATAGTKQFDANYVWSKVFDPATNTIRVVIV